MLSAGNLVDGRKKTNSDVEGKASVDPSVAKGINFFFFFGLLY